MAFAATTTVKTVMGNKRVHYGGFTQASGDTGGDVVTGFNSVEYFDASYSTGYSVSDGTVTITTADPGGAQSGFWMAIGT